MHDTDMAQRLYFARQFRFANDALEDWSFSRDLDYFHLAMEKGFMFVIVHAEADYYKQMRVGEEVEIHLSCEHIGTTSFSLMYQIYRNKDEMVGLCRTVHVTISTKTGEKIPLPDALKEHLQKIFVK
ncbi:MAG: acyl-CoA thioesterase [Chlamydiia bacterium]|nr:acyl-CoA thioesterase [Chlamydiia bacterium]